MESKKEQPRFIDFLNNFPFNFTVFFHYDGYSSVCDRQSENGFTADVIIHIIAFPLALAVCAVYEN